MDDIFEFKCLPSYYYYYYYCVEVMLSQRLTLSLLALFLFSYSCVRICALRPKRDVSGGSSKIQKTPRFQMRPWFF